MIFKKYRQQAFVRSDDAEDFLEIFLVAGVVSFLGIRFFLDLTGYPQLGGATFHIAHVLWGGFFLTAALILKLAFLDKASSRVAAVLGGIGFGAFIDELGKFITRDNDYFFQPTVALIYVTFVFLFLAFRFITKRRKLSSEEAVQNALEIAKEAVLHRMDARERKRLAQLMEEADQEDSLFRAFRPAFQRLVASSPNKADWYDRLRELLRIRYARLVRTWWFPRLLVAVLLFSTTIGVFRALAVAEGLPGLVFSSAAAVFVGLSIFGSPRKIFSPWQMAILIAGFLGAIFLFGRSLLNLEFPELSFAQSGLLLFSAVSGMLVVLGMFWMPYSRAEAYRVFRMAILIGIFLSNFFAFLQEEFSALVGLAGNIALLVILNSLIAQEEGMNGVAKEEKKQ